jgi:hypothetical protein
MRKTAATLVLAALLIAGCMSEPGVPSESGWRCSPLPEDFQATDLVGTWKSLYHWGDRLILREDGTCQQVYENEIANRYFTSECTWYLEQKWGGFYLHAKGMHYCISIDSLCERAGGGGGDWLYYDACSGRVVEMPDEVVLSVSGPGDYFERVYGHPAPRGIVLQHMQADPDTTTVLLILDE